MLYKRSNYRNPLAPRCIAEPVAVIKEIDEDQGTEEIVVKKKKKKSKRYLPGERLLIKLNKDREDKPKTKKHQPLDMSAIHQSISEIVSGFD